MATLAPKGTYVFLDDAAVWMDYSTGRIHITSNDHDVPEGVHVNIRPGTKTDEHLRDLLEKYRIPLTLEGRDERRRNVDHSLHDHPATPEARAVCRAAAAAQDEPTTGFVRLPPASNPGKTSAHHHRMITWNVQYRLTDAEDVAEAVHVAKLWSGRESLATNGVMNATLTYGPVWGGYLADLRRLFAKMHVGLLTWAEVRFTCLEDCTHMSHR